MLTKFISILIISTSALVLVVLSAPASQAAEPPSKPHPNTLQVPSTVEGPEVFVDNYTATSPAQALINVSKVDAGTAATVSSGLPSGARFTVVATALSYMGTPYVLNGASHQAIDCSGLTMVAYAAVGIHLVHYVTSQDDAGQTIPASQARPGDLVVFNNDDHEGVYLGHGLVLHAPDYGQVVHISALSTWTDYHFVKFLS